MSQPTIADRKPIAVNLKKDEEQYWCACGRSKNQPFCDGSHRGSDFVPKAFTPDEDGEAYLCMCKHTGNAPYCDGTHAKLPQSSPAETQAAVKANADDVQPTPEEPTVKQIHDLAKYGLSKVGHHGEMGAMGVPRTSLPQWDDIQILTAQMATQPLMDDVAVGTELTIGPNAKKPLILNITRCSTY